MNCSEYMKCINCDWALWREDDLNNPVCSAKKDGENEVWHLDSCDNGRFLPETKEHFYDFTRKVGLGELLKK